MVSTMDSIFILFALLKFLKLAKVEFSTLFIRIYLYTIGTGFSRRFQHTNPFSDPSKAERVITVFPFCQFK